MPETETAGEATGKGFQQQLGPLKVWQWGAIVIGSVIAIVIVRKFVGGGSATTTDAAGTASGGGPPDISGAFNALSQQLAQTTEALKPNPNPIGLIDTTGQYGGGHFLSISALASGLRSVGIDTANMSPSEIVSTWIAWVGNPTDNRKPSPASNYQIQYATVGSSILQSSNSGTTTAANA